MYVLKSTGEEILPANPKADCRHIVTAPDGTSGFDADHYGLFYIPGKPGHTGRHELIRHENVEKVEA